MYLGILEMFYLFFFLQFFFSLILYFSFFWLSLKMLAFSSNTEILVKEWFWLLE